MYVFTLMYVNMYIRKEYSSDWLRLVVLAYEIIFHAPRRYYDIICSWLPVCTKSKHFLILIKRQFANLTYAKVFPRSVTYEEIYFCLVNKLQNSRLRNQSHQRVVGYFLDITTRTSILKHTKVMLY